MATMGFITENVKNKKNDTILVPDTFTHAVAIGQTGSGKTTSFIYPNIQYRIKRGHGLLVYDYKGKEHKFVKYFAQQNNRLDDVIEIGKPWGSSINIIRNMTKQDLENFFETLLAHSPENKYWGLSAQTIGINILDLLENLENLRYGFEETGFEFGIDSSYEVSGFTYPARKTLNALVECTMTLDTLEAFIESLDELESSLEEKIRGEITNEFKNLNKDELKKLFQKILDTFIALKNSIADVKKAISIFLEGDARTTKIMLASLVSPLTLIAQNSFFNTDDLDITSALNDGKIIIINPSGISDNILENLNLSIFNELSKRSSLRNTNPITIFMDEAQRLLSETVPLPTDVLREAKVDVMLSFQDPSLVISKIGEENYKGLLSNLSNHYYFRNNADNRLNMLKTFEYYTNHENYQKLHISNPVFINVHKIHLAEFKYQRKHNVLARFANSHKGKKMIIEYIPRLFLQKKFIAYDLNSEKESIIPYEDVSLRKESGYLFNTLYASCQEMHEFEESCKNYDEETFMSLIEEELAAG